ncbi:hypothetical protein EVAR_38751_1 [Eumeta japonica]|uniref:Uncharacterized protein n=1 Tax=Eumeta variegata TaxID=151549 RepID=A0A4C1WMK9_EUMVA|nr:hypothetical protein EVAR_38751_1 [Eumeta japonica]
MGVGQLTRNIRKWIPKSRNAFHGRVIFSNELSNNIPWYPNIPWVEEKKLILTLLVGKSILTSPRRPPCPYAPDAVAAGLPPPPSIIQKHAVATPTRGRLRAVHTPHLVFSYSIGEAMIVSAYVYPSRADAVNERQSCRETPGRHARPPEKADQNLNHVLRSLKFPTRVRPAWKLRSSN